MFGPLVSANAAAVVAEHALECSGMALVGLPLVGIFGEPDGSPTKPLGQPIQGQLPQFFASVHQQGLLLGIAAHLVERFRAQHHQLEIVAPMQNLFTLVTTGKWYAVVNFRETDLKFIAPEDCATVYSMIDRRTPIKGVVESIGWGVLDTDRVNLPKNMPYVERSLNWVRVAQRFPVRVRLMNPPENLMRLGASAVVEVKHGAACS